MAGRAILGKHGSTPGRCRGIKCLARELQDKFGNIVDLLGRQDFICAKSGHWRLPRIRIGCEANAMLQCRVDLIQSAAPQPVIIIKIGIAFATGCARAMALDAIHPEGRPPARHCELQKVGVLANFLKRKRFHPFKLGRLGRPRNVNIFQQIRAAGIAEKPGSCAIDQRPGRIDDHVSQCKSNAAIEGPQPPPWHGCIEFLDTIPFMAGGFSSRDFISFTRSHDGSILTIIIKRNAGSMVVLGA